MNKKKPLVTVRWPWSILLFAVIVAGWIALAVDIVRWLGW